MPSSKKEPLPREQVRRGRVRDACCNNTIKTASKRASRQIDLPQPCRGMEGLALLPLAGGARVRFFWSRVCVSESHPINSNGLRGLSNSSCVFFRHPPIPFSATLHAEARPPRPCFQGRRLRVVVHVPTPYAPTFPYARALLTPQSRTHTGRASSGTCG